MESLGQATLLEVQENLEGTHLADREEDLEEAGRPVGLMTLEGRVGLAGVVEVVLEALEDLAVQEDLEVLEVLRLPEHPSKVLTGQKNGK